MTLLQINTTACNGSDVFWPWFLWLLGAFILGAILGWLLRCILGNCGGDDDSSEWESKYNKTKSDLDACMRDKKSALDKAAMAATAMAATKTAVAKPTKKDDLKKVEGIGPKIEEHLNNSGIWSWAQLASASISTLQGVLDKAGPAYTIHNPKTWPEQAKMADEGKWDALNKWQDELKGGL